MNRISLSFVALAVAASSLHCIPEDEGGGGGGGGVVAFSQGFVFVRSDDHNVYLADKADFTRVARLSTAGNARHPSLSRDGRQVVFVRSFAGDTELLTVPTTGGIAPTRILASTATQRNFRSPVFSPDGKQIVFAFDEGSASFLGRVGADGSAFSKLAGSSSLSYAAPSFYPDGLSVLAIAGSSLSGYTQLERITLTTGIATSVTNNLGTAALQIANRAVVSPDGTRAAFDARIAGGANRIFVIQLASRVVTQLTDYPSEPTANDSFPTWVAGDKVGFSSDSGGNDSVYALPASATKTSGGLQMASAIEPWYGPHP